MTENYQTIVGMEIHVELKTLSKMFCGCKNDPFNAPKPNIYTCPVCLGLPGALPVPNRKAIEWTVLLGLALGSEISLFSKFDRKNYFYPDLPKGYQISQYDTPFCTGGRVQTTHGEVGITRVHLEEDTGKLRHATIDGKPKTLIDFNRSGVPLVEIVTEPDIHSGEQAKEFLKKLQQIIRYLEISDADMEKGSMRLEPNISVQRPKVSELPKYKVEVKNINSFNFVKKAIEYEVQRHIKIIETGQTPVQETRGYKSDQGITFTQRVKETADDYRYFPEPDIPPIRWEKSQIENIRKLVPELPDTKKTRFMDSYAINEYDATILSDTKQVANYFEASVKAAKKLSKDISPKTIANWIINRKVETDKIVPVELIHQISQSVKVEEIPESEVIKIIEDVLKANPKAVADYRKGKEQAMIFLVGQVMKISGGKVNVSKAKLKIIQLI